MLEIMTDELNRYKFVFMSCNHLYFDAKKRQFCCACSATDFDDVIRCKRCKRGTLKAHITNNPIIDLRKLDA